MPALSEAWRVIRRFLAGPPPVERQTGESSSWFGLTRLRDDSADPLSGSRWYEFCERTAQQRRDAMRERELARQELLRKERRALRRSLVLLVRLLSPEQRQEFRKTRYFHVVGG